MQKCINMDVDDVNISVALGNSTENVQLEVNIDQCALSDGQQSACEEQCRGDEPLDIPRKLHSISVNINDQSGRRVALTVTWNN